MLLRRWLRANVCITLETREEAERNLYSVHILFARRGLLGKCIFSTIEDEGSSTIESYLQMEENNVRTSVVIELANQEEPKDQKMYQIDIDEVEVPKDYVIDQIFCGENITVYALFEVPEEATSEKRLVEVSNSNLHEDYRFFHRDSYNNTMNEKKTNGYRHNLSVMHSEEDLKFIAKKDKGNESLYCLKHLGGDYDVLTPERKTSELRVLYSKEFVSKSSKPSKFKVVSKGVNTDIVQSPKIIEEVQKAVGLNIPFISNKEKNIDNSSSSLSKSSYEIIEMEMRQSFTSLSSHSDCRRCNKNSVPNFFLVPLLMMEDGLLGHYKKEKKSKKEEENMTDSKFRIAPKVSLGTNTDLSFEKTDQSPNEMSQSDSELNEAQKICLKKDILSQDSKLRTKEMIILEIKKMQEKLNNLIRTIESDDFTLTTKEDDVMESETKPCDAVTDNLERMSETLLSETFQKNYQSLDERPIFLPFSYPTYPNESKAKAKKRTQNNNQVRKSELPEPDKSSGSANEFLKKSQSFTTIVENNEQSKVSPKEEPSISKDLQTIFQEPDSRKVAGLSKSESNVRVVAPDAKHNVHGLKKSLSLDLKDDKVEVLKKIKNFSFKLEGSLKAKTNLRILQNNEPHSGDNLPTLKCEMGDDASKKSKHSNNDLLTLTQGDDKVDNISIKEMISDTKKTFNEEEGDAKSVYQKENLALPTFEQTSPKLQFYNTSIVSSEGLLKPKKSLSPYRVKSRTVDKISETGTKVFSEMEKPITPNKSCRKINSTDLNAKKDNKVNNKKANNKTKVNDKSNKFEGKDVFQLELDKKKSVLSGVRKSTRNSADSKLHVDKLIKLDILSNHKIPPSAPKSNHEEKAGMKSDRLPRPVSQKRDRSEHPIDVLPEEKGASEFKVSSNKSVTLVQADGCTKKGIFASNFEDISENETVGEIQQNNDGENNSNHDPEKMVPVASNPSSVVVELFSKKPKSVDDFYSEVGQECANLEKTLRGEKNGAEKESNENSNNQEKPIIKSVWALTKVLLFEDGTKKLEVLEASLTPPGYSLNQTLKSENE